MDCQQLRVDPTLGKAVIGGPPYPPVLPTDDRWAWWMKQILTPLIVAIGIGGNCLSFIVMKTRSWRHKSYSHFLCALAVFDSLTLINREILLVHELREYAGDSGLYAGFSDIACSIHNFYEHMCYLMSSWLIVCMAMERVVAVYFPLRKAFLCTPNGAVIVILVLIMLLTYTQVFRFFMVGKIDDKCVAFTDYLTVYTSLHVYLYQFTLIFILPVVTVLTCNILVLFKIYRVMKPRSPNGTTLSRSRRNVAKTHKTTLMLLTISFVYVITLFPSVVVSIIVHVAIATRYTGMRELFMRIRPLTDLFELCSDLNYCSNFFIYILSGKMFRYELRRIFAFERSTALTATSKARDEMALV
ncbi:FMRFamide peptide receptor frpr-18-like [Haliotis asinina]|uniref:FMRFamide peptide receptor frpr-18-like n=1 Tax=Haliotis asinina TaxID=109174 RepID=UPI0035324E7B